MERLWYVFSKGDVTLIKQLMEQFENSGAVSVPEHILTKVRIIKNRKGRRTDKLFKCGENFYFLETLFRGGPRIFG